MGTHDNNANMTNYFRSSTNKVADKRASEVLTKKTHEFSVVFSINVKGFMIDVPLVQ